ncbi:hypothetical protein NKR23_g12469 [Pleurostoma richardsiae]|uniref:Uncharacterized protein n=1 Tax=Pleurostoma richardsiae TaxID=41990 RepID=A0AA38R7F9_9PEZI|nr:hypothetical protein NKR23_g12469 [Pleurostoma richardsiae]
MIGFGSKKSLTAELHEDDSYVLTTGGFKTVANIKTEHFKTQGTPNNKSKWQLTLTYGPFLALAPTTFLSLLLLISDRKHWVASPSIYVLIAANRATIQLVVQVLASILGFLNFLIVCKLINYHTRLRLSKASMSLEALRFWNSLLSQQLNTKVPIHLLVPLVVFLGLGVVPSALWAAAITPVVVTVTKSGQLQLPSYASTDVLVDGWRNRSGLPSTRSTKGLFTYNVGERFQGSLLEAASTATTVDGNPGLRSKLDFTGYSYIGRSYGVGTSVGLVDDDIQLNSLANQYTYLEAGYLPTVKCIYNETTQFVLGKDTSDGKMFFSAGGYLPNSYGADGKPILAEWSRYPGYTTDSIVALGVATIIQTTRRIIGIASGAKYPNLNTTQCETIFSPTLFNITVQLGGRNITVTPVANATVDDIEPHGNLTYLANWQLMLISTDQTSLYTSLVGNSFNSSIENYITAQDTLGKTAPSAADATLRGLENSVTAMMDGILTGYAGAQLMVANETTATNVYVDVQALRFGQGVWINTVVVVNTVMILLVLLEAVRTRGWSGLSDFDYTEPTDLVFGVARACESEALIQWEDDGGGMDRLRIAQRGKTLVLQVGKGL